METIEAVKEKLNRRTEEVNELILGVERSLITFKVPDKEDISIEKLQKMIKDCSDYERLFKLIEVNIRDVYEQYTYLLELEVEKKRGEMDKKR